MLSRGDIVLIPFPFTDLTSNKIRPALVVSSNSFNKQGHDAIFAFITSQKHNSSYDIQLPHSYPSFAATGLKKSSPLRTAKLMCLNQQLARRRLGHASRSILDHTARALKELLAL